MQKKEILIIGPSIETSGIGGVTIHLQRLCEHFEKNLLDYKFCDYKKDFFVKQIKMIKESKLVHLHVCNSFRLLVLLLICMFYKKIVVFTYHGNVLSQNKICYMLDMFAIKKCTIPVLINEDSYNHVKKVNTNSVLMSAFIPPIEEKESLPKDILERIGVFKSKIRYLYSTNASARIYDAHNKEIYGIDFLIDCFSRNTTDGLIIFDPSNQYAEYYKNQCFKNIIIISGKHSYYAMIRESDFIVRNTCKDGDSLTVKEGLHQKKIVLCSDCVQRPLGVLLFHYNDIRSFEDAKIKAEYMLREPMSVWSENEMVVELIKLYRNLLCH